MWSNYQGGASLKRRTDISDPNSIYNPNLFWSSWAAGAGATSYCNMRDTEMMFTDVDLFYLKQPSGGTFKFGLFSNGATQTAIDTNNATKALASSSYSGFGTDRQIQCSNITGAVHLIGCNLRNGSTGVRVHRLAQGGVKADEIANLDATAYTDFLKKIGCDLIYYQCRHE